MTDRRKLAGRLQEFYSRGQGILRPHEIQKSYALMKCYLGTPQLAFSTWVQLRPIFQTLLADALIEADMDLVACAAREYVRVELGGAPDQRYGYVEPLGTPQRDLLNTDDEECYADPGSEWDALHTSDCAMFFKNREMYDCFSNPAEFDKQFPGKSKHRLNMARALEPIFERDWFGYWPVIDRAYHHAKLLLAIKFREGQLTSGISDNSPVVEPGAGALLVPRHEPGGRGTLVGALP